MKKFNTIYAVVFFLIQIVHCTLIIDNCKAQWVQTNGPDGGMVRCLAISGNSIFAGTYGGGVFFSTDNGGNWNTAGLSNIWITAIAINGNNIITGTYGNGIFFSSNYGANWTEINNGLTNLNISSLAISGNNIFAGTFGNGIFLSSNNGANWTAVNNGLTNLSVTCFSFIGNNIFAGTYGGVFLSTNNGGNWTAVNNGLITQYISKLAVSGNNLFAGTELEGIFFTTNNGANWYPATKHAIPYMLENGRGSIVNLSSIYGLISAPDVPPYHASKGAVRSMSKTDALLYASKKIRVNSVHPGFIWTPMVENHLKKLGDINEGRKMLDSLHPLGHIGESIDIAYGILYLASDESKFVTGSELVIDGGYTVR